MIHTKVSPAPEPSHARAWVQILAKYREPRLARSLFEMAATLGPFIALWALAWWALSVSWLLAIVISAANGLFLVRVFTIQHDCGHGAFFPNRQMNEWVGRICGVLTVTPYYVWHRAHSIHHSHSGNLNKRGLGEIATLTVEEYRQRSWLGRLRYRAYRHPLVLFGLGPAYVFLVENRVPLGFIGKGPRYWVSAMGTNISMAAALGAIFWFGGWQPLVLVFLPTTLIAATLGVWLFYVQHQFEETHWEEEPEWQVHDAALHGSSHYVLPPVLQWMTANIGIHHVHHLYSRIPFYRLTEVLRDHKELADAQRLTIRESFKCVGLQLWDQSQRRLLSFREARRTYGPIAA